MKEVLIWLLVSLPNGTTSYSAQPHAHVVAHFLSVQECQRISKVLLDTDPGGWTLKLRCVEARVAVPKGIS